MGVSFSKVPGLRGLSGEFLVHDMWTGGRLEQLLDGQCVFQGKEWDVQEGAADSESVSRHGR